MRQQVICRLSMIFIVLLSVAAAGQMKQSGSSDTVRRVNERNGGNLGPSTIHLGPGDLVDIRVFGAPELGNTLRMSGEAKSPSP